jgi:hypothetical protein
VKIRNPKLNIQRSKSETRFIASDPLGEDVAVRRATAPDVYPFLAGASALPIVT